MRGFKIIAPALIIWAAGIAGLLAQGTAPVVRYGVKLQNKRLEADIERLSKAGDQDSISVILGNEGYLNNSVRQYGDTVLIDPGVRFQWGDFGMMIVHSDARVENGTFTQFRDRNASLSGMVEIKDQLISPYYRKGYYFASLNTEQVALKEDIIDVQFKLITGPRVTIERVRFKGLKRSRPEFVLALSGLRQGDPFVADQLNEAIRRLESEGYLRNDSLPQIQSNENYDGVELVFYLTELKSNRFELGGGYLPRRGEQGGEFVGKLLFETRNLFGSGREAAILINRKDRASSQVEFRFAQPIFIPDHLELSLYLSQVDYDSSYYSFSADVEASLITRGDTRISSGISWAKTEPQRSSQPPSRTLSGMARYETRQLDYFPNPSSGRHLQFVVSYIHRISWPDTVSSAIINNESMFDIAADNYVFLGGAFVFRLNAQARVLITSREIIDFSEQFKLGGFGSLRGYRQDQFAGHRTLLGQAELRLRPSRDFAAYLFSDIGYVYGRKEVSAAVIGSEGLTRIGSGFGLFIGGANANLTMEIGWGQHDNLGDGKIHLGLSTLF